MEWYNRQKIHQSVYLFGLALLITCIPLSLYFLSIAQFLLALNWILEGNFREKLIRLRQDKAIAIFASVFVLYVIGYFFSNDKAMGAERLKNALPLIALPVIIGTSHSPGIRNIQRLFLLFCAGVLAAAMVCIVNYLINGLPPGANYRQISIILPHIRFAILIVMAIAILIYFTFLVIPDPLFNKKRTAGIIYLSIAVFLTGFLFFLRSATGIMLFAIVITVLILNIAVGLLNRMVRITIISVLSVLILCLFSITVYTWFRNFHSGATDYSHLEVFTDNGNLYLHDTVSGLLENGNYTELYICEPEMQREWNKISKVDFFANDSKGQPVRSTLKRYLTSKGLRKDSASIHHLTGTDISKIEEGLANYRFSEDPGIFQRLYETLYEIHVFNRTGFVEKHSFGQRLAFAIESYRVFIENPVTGTGTGDVYSSLQSQAEKDRVTIDANWQGKPHNQFAFWLIAFGIIGLFWIVVCWIYPAMKHRPGLLFTLFILVILISMLVMDTLESYSSMTFFAVFYSLLVFSKTDRSMQAA